MWLIVSGTLIVAGTVWYLARPLAYATNRTANERRHQLGQLRDRLLAQLDELDVEEGDHNIDTAVVGDERRRMEAELATVLRELESQEQGAGSANAQAATRKLWLKTLLVLAIVLPLSAGSLYLLNQRTTLAQLANGGTPETAEVPPMVLEMVARLERRLASEPNDPEGWARLGRAYDVLGRPADAKAAYSRAYRLAPDNPEILADYAAVLMAENPHQPSPEAVSLFKKLHRLNPRHPAALWVLGLVAYNSADYARAVQYWEGLLKELPPGSEIEPQVRKAIETARSRVPKD